mgnify:CR=1 FL=1
MKSDELKVGQLVICFDGIGIVLGLEADLVPAIQRKLEKNLSGRDKKSLETFYNDSVTVSCYIVCPYASLDSDYMKKITLEYALKMAEHLLKRPMNKSRLTTMSSNYIDVLGQIDTDKVNLWLVKSKMMGADYTFIPLDEVKEKVLKPFCQENKEELEQNKRIDVDTLYKLENPKSGEFVVAKTSSNYLFYVYIGVKNKKPYYLPVTREQHGIGTTLWTTYSSLLRQADWAFKNKTVCSIKHQLYGLHLMFPNTERVKEEYDNI